MNQAKALGVRPFPSWVFGPATAKEGLSVDTKSSCYCDRPPGASAGKLLGSAPGSQKPSAPCLGTSRPALQESQRVLLFRQPFIIHGWAEPRAQAPGNQCTGSDWTPRVQLAQRTLCCFPEGIRQGVGSGAICGRTGPCGFWEPRLLGMWGGESNLPDTGRGRGRSGTARFLLAWGNGDGKAPRSLPNP